MVGDLEGERVRLRKNPTNSLPSFTRRIHKMRSLLIAALLLVLAVPAFAGQKRNLCVLRKAKHCGQVAVQAGPVAVYAPVRRARVCIPCQPAPVQVQVAVPAPQPVVVAPAPVCVAGQCVAVPKTYETPVRNALFGKWRTRFVPYTVQQPTCQNGDCGPSIVQPLPEPVTVQPVQ